MIPQVFSQKPFLQRCLIFKHIKIDSTSYLVHVSSYDENWSFGCVNGDRTQPELKSCVFVAQSDVPYQEINRPVGQEKLKQRYYIQTGSGTNTK
jgi:hypothetical protein